MKLNLLYAYILVAASCLFTDGQGRLLGVKATKDSKSPKTLKASKAPKSSKSSSSDTAAPSTGPTAAPLDCDATTFGELQNATAGADPAQAVTLALCSGTIVFTKQIDLSGKQLAFTCPDGDCVLDAESNSRFFEITGGTSDFDGITFKNGKVLGEFGGAIYNSRGTVDISACRFVGNTGGITEGVGGGAILNQGGTVDITGSEFVDNTARNGGAIFNFGGTMNITGSKFVDNTSDNFGGAIITVDGGVSSVTITGSEFKRNTANGGNAEYGDNIYKQSLGDLTCDDGTNTFNNPGGNYPVDLCAS